MLVRILIFALCYAVIKSILLISIKLGEEVFLGLSVPFEVKALIVLAIGKLFEPVLDQLGMEFQAVVNHVSDIRDKYFS